MSKEYTSNQSFKNDDFAASALPVGEYEACTFAHCNFSNADLSGNRFIDCAFEHCDLSMAVLKDTAFQEVTFKHCKLLGLHFDDCNGFSLSFAFENCVLNFASFFRVKLKNTAFSNCKLEEADFVEADLSHAVFVDCDLKNAVFENTNMEGADFRTAFNFAIDPELNRIVKAKFSRENVLGLLGRYKISIE